MIRIALFLAMLLSLPLFTANYAVASDAVPVNATLKKQLLGAPVYIQIFKISKARKVSTTWIFTT